MPTSPRRRTDPVALITKVLDAAEELLERDGPAGLTARAVAARASVSPQSIANRFGSMDEVRGDLAARGFRRLVEAILLGGDRPLATIDDPSEFLGEAMQRHRTFATEHPHLFLLMMSPHQPARVRAEAQELQGLLEVLVERAVDAGVLTDGDPAVMATLLWATMTGSVVLDSAVLGEAGAGR